MNRALLAVVALAVSACVISEERTYFPLPSGPLIFASYQSDPSSCFPEGVPGPPYGGVDATVSGTALELRGLRALLLPSVPQGNDLSGTSRGDGFHASSVGQISVSTACTLSFVNRIDGLGYTVNEAFAILSVQITGTGCAGFPGTTIDNIPFPALSSSTAGTCSASVRGILSPDPSFVF